MTTQKKIVLANLKAYRSPTQVEQWCDSFLASLRNVPETLEIVLAVPDLAMERAFEKIKGRSGISLAAQALSSFPQGSYTGSTPAAWLRDLVRYSLAGHHERRTYFHESVQDVARQVHEALAEEIIPIICVEGEYFHQQLAALSYEEREQVWWAFTPKTETALVLRRDLPIITETVAKMGQQSGKRPVLYGGGITSENGGARWAVPGISGIMAGAACLDALVFASLIQRLR